MLDLKKRFRNAIILSRVQPDFRQLHEFRYATGLVPGHMVILVMKCTRGK